MNTKYDGNYQDSRSRDLSRAFFVNQKQKLAVSKNTECRTFLGDHELCTSTVDRSTSTKTETHIDQYYQFQVDIRPGFDKEFRKLYNSVKKSGKSRKQSAVDIQSAK